MNLFYYQLGYYTAVFVSALVLTDIVVRILDLKYKMKRKRLDRDI